MFKLIEVWSGISVMGAIGATIIGSIKESTWSYVGDFFIVFIIGHIIAFILSGLVISNLDRSKWLTFKIWFAQIASAVIYTSIIIVFISGGLDKIF